ncbi:MAG: sulfatase [bacterium]
MNIIYIHTHDSGKFFEPYGYHLPTPNIKQLAEEGALFRHCYNTAPTCSPSRSGMLTGMTPHSCGMLGLAHRGWQLNDYSQHLVQYLNQKGLDTILCGIQHEAPETEMIGYSKVLGVQNYDMDDTLQDRAAWDLENARSVAGYLRDYADSNQESPFFLSFGMFNTHREFPEPQSENAADYIKPPFPLYDCQQNREDMAGYIESVKVVDKCTGIVLDTLRETELMEDTLIIFTTDHGIAFPRMKCNLYDTGIGVALIIKSPHTDQKGIVTDELVSQLDIFPTICDLLDMETPEHLQGQSLRPLLEGKNEKIRDEIFAEVTYHAAYEPMRCVRTERYKLIKFFDFHNNIVPANIDDSLSKDFLLERDYLNNCREKEMLFDLHLDPVERENLIDDPRYSEIYNDLSRRLGDWMEETDDPLLDHAYRVPLCEGAFANKRTTVSPRADDFEEG